MTSGSEEEARHDSRDDNSDIYLRPRIDQPGWTRLRIRRSVRATHRQTAGWLDCVFLVTTVLTSVTGFAFPFDHLLPSHMLGIISLVVLTVAILARYGFHLEGAWRQIYVITAVLAFYLECFRRRNPGLPEGPCAEGTGSDTEGASLPGRAVRRSVASCRAHDSRFEEVPDRVDASGLIWIFLGVRAVGKNKFTT